MPLQISNLISLVSFRHLSAVCEDNHRLNTKNIAEYKKVKQKNLLLRRHTCRKLVYLPAKPGFPCQPCHWQLSTVLASPLAPFIRAVRWFQFIHTSSSLSLCRNFSHQLLARRSFVRCERVCATFDAFNSRLNVCARSRLDLNFVRLISQIWCGTLLVMTGWRLPACLYHCAYNL